MGGARGLLIAAFAFFLLAASAPAQPADSFVFRQIRSALSEQGVDLQAESFDYSVTGLSIDLRGVTMRAVGKSDAPPFFRARQIQATVTLRTLLGGTPRITKAHVEKPVIRIVNDPAGDSNLPSGGGPSEPASPPSEGLPAFFIDLLTVSDGDFTLEEPEAAVSVKSSGWNLRVEGNPSRSSHAILLTGAQRGGFTKGGSTLPLRTLSASLVLTRTALLVEGVNAVLGNNRLRATGKLEPLQSPEFDLGADADLDLAELAQVADLATPVRGRVQTRVRVTGPLSQVKIEGQLEGGDLAASGVRPISVSARAAFDRGSERLQLDSLAVRSPLGAFDAEGRLGLSDRVESSLLVRFDRLSLQGVSETIGLQPALAAVGDGQATAKWPGLNLEQTQFEGSVDLKRASPTPKGTAPVSLNLRFNGGPNAIRLNLSSLQALGVRLNGEVQLDSFPSLAELPQARIDARLKGGIADLTRFLSELEGFLGSLPEGAPKPEEIGGGVELQLVLTGTLPTPGATLTAQSSDLRLGDFNGVAAELEVLVNRQRIDLRRLNLNWNQAAASAVGRYDHQTEPATMEAALQIRNFPLPPLLAALGRDLALEGQLDTDLQVSGSPRRPKAEFHVLASRLAGYSQPPATLQLSGRVDGQRLEVTEAVLTQEGPGHAAGRAALQGFWNAETGGFQLDAQASGLRIVPDARLGNLGGVFELQASGRGTLESPNLQASFRGGQLLVDGNPAGDVTADLEIRDGEGRLNLEAPAFAARTNVDFSLLEPQPYRLEAQFQQLDLAALPVQQPEGLHWTGELTASVAAEGTLQNWRQSTARLDIPELALRLNGREIGIAEPVRVRLQDERLRIEAATLQSGSSRLTLTGDIPLAPESQGRLETNGSFELSDLERWVPDAGVLYLDGAANLQGAITGSLTQLDPRLRLTVDAATMAHDSLNSPVEDVGLELDLSDGAVHLRRFQARLDAATVSAQGRFPLGLLEADLPMEAASGAARLDAQLIGFSPSSLSAAPQDLSGDVTATLQAQADRLSFDAVTATAEFQRLDFTLQGYKLGQTSPTRLALRDRIATVENFAVAGPSLNLRVSGDTLLFDPRMYDLKITGDLDASVVSQFVENLNATGVTKLEASLAGPLDAPELNGYLQASDIDLRLRSPRIQAESLNLRLDFSGDRVEIAQLSGQINGGPISGSGGFQWAGLQPSDVALDLDAREVFLNFPEGLRTLSDVSLRLRSSDDVILLGGQINLNDGSFTENIDLESQLLQLIRSGGPEVPAEPNPLLEKLRFNIALDTVNPLLINNNLARLEMNVDLTARGDFYRPGLTGNITLAEGGELYLREKTYLIDRGTILLLDQTRIAPTLDVLARTKAGRYDITLKITGPPDDLSTEFTSDPPLPEPDIIAVLITGRTLDELRGAEANVAKEQTLSYLTGTFGSRLGAEAEKALGLSKVRIEPNLIAPESSPGARLTIGEDLSRDLRLIYSTNLVDSGDQIYIAEYDITRRFVTRGIKQADNTYRFEFNHDLRFGGAPPRSAASGVGPSKIGDIRFEGETFFTPEELRKKLKLKEGQDFDFFRVRKGVDRLENWYRKNDLLESRIRLQREAQNGVSDLNFQIRPGPRVRFEFIGDQISDSLRRKVRDTWAEGVFDAQRSADASLQIQEALIRKGHLTPRIVPEILQPTEAEKTVRFNIEKGPRFEDVPLEFPGASGLAPELLRQSIEEADLFPKLLSEPGEAVDFLTALYRREGFLSAKIENPRLLIPPESAQPSIVIPIEEGAPARIATIRLEGNRIVDDETLLASIPLKEGGPYRPGLRENSRQSLQDLYWSMGYNDVRIEDSLRAAKPGDPFDLLYRIREGRKGVVREINAEGFNRTNERFILRQLEIAPGDPLIFEKLSRSRKRLYDTGAYSLVEIDSEPIEATGDDEVKPVRLKVRVRELSPFELRYGGFYDTDRGLGVTADFRNRNSLGSARVVGLRTRYDGDVREMRGYFSQPALRNLPLKTTVDGFIRREIRPDFITDRQGISLQQEAKLRDRFVFSYGYRFERNDTFERDPDPIFGFDIPPFNVAALTSTLTRDTRDDILDATRGNFTSAGVEYAQDFLGSDLRFVRFFGQHYRYYPLSQAEEIPWSGGERQPRWVFASGVRVGLARGLGGQIVVPSERFFAGGGTTIRGFEQDAIGQDTDLFGGGDALFIFNNELRFPVYSIFDGVAFVDIGNVYANISDFDPFDTREAAGLGLRVRTPYFLIRLDYGVKLDRRDGESFGEFFFSIGQAF